MIQYAAIILFVFGLYGLFTNKNIIKMIVSLNIMEIGLNLFIISIGFVYDQNAVAPIITSTNGYGSIFVDPLPQPLVLTAIVIGVGTTALALAFAKSIHNKYNTLDLGELEDRL